MKKLSHKTVFMLLGVLVLIFVLVFGIKYWQSQYSFTEIDKVGNSEYIPEIEKELSDNLKIEEEQDSLKKSIISQKFIDAGYFEIRVTELNKLINNKQNLLVNINDLDLNQAKQPLKKIIEKENCLDFTEINKIFCNNPGGDGIPPVSYSFLGFLDGYYYIRAQLYEGFYNLRINEISGDLNKIGDNFIVYNNFIISDNEIDNASKISIYQDKKGFVNHVIAEPGSFILKNIYEIESNKLLIHILNEQEENSYFSIDLSKWIQEQREKEKKDEQAFQNFLHEIGGEEVDEEQFSLNTSGKENLIVNFPKNLHQKTEKFNLDINRKDNCLIFKNKISHVQPLCNVYYKDTEVNDYFLFYNFTYNNKYYVIPTFNVEYWFNTLINKDSGDKINLESDFAEIDGIFIENHKFDPLNGALITFSKNKITEDESYINVDLISYYDLGWDIYEIYSSNNFTYISLYISNDEHYVDLKNLKYIKLDLSKIPELN